MNHLFDELREDLAWSNVADGRPIPVCFGRLKTLAKCWFKRGTKAVLLYRLAYRLRLKGWKRLAGFLCCWAFRSCHTQISPAARIAGGLRLPHPQGVIIGSSVEIDCMVTIGQHVTLGGNFDRHDETGRGMPRIGNGVVICAGSVVAGPVDVGPRTIIGANSVVIRSLPPDSVAGGAPARVLRMRQTEEHHVKIDNSTHVEVS